MTDSESNDPLERCPGCGVRLQTNDVNQVGYVPPAALDRRPVICQRCFRIKNYNESTPAPIAQDEFMRLLHHVAERKSLVVHIVDIFDFEGSLISGLRRFVGNNPVLLVVNKIDLLPKGINRNRLLNWVQQTVKHEGLKVDDILLCSARNGFGLERIAAAIHQRRKERDIFVVGATNVGKSSFINRFIRDYGDLSEELTVSRYPGTTLDLVEIKLRDGHYLIDTPGIVYPSRMSEIIDPNELQIIVPERTIKPVVYQLNERQTLFFGALARFDFIQGERQSFTCYMANTLQIHRTKLEQADEVYERHKGVMLKPPAEQRMGDLPPFVKHSFRIAGDGHADLLISGLGWVKVNGTRGALVELQAPKGVKVVLRKALI